MTAATAGGAKDTTASITAAATTTGLVLGVLEGNVDFVDLRLCEVVRGLTVWKSWLVSYQYNWQRGNTDPRTEWRKSTAPKVPVTMG